LNEKVGHEEERLQGHTGKPLSIKQYVKLKYLDTTALNKLGPK